MTEFKIGQRWISETEPELGLGTVAAIGERTLSVLFRASGSRREYALDNAPLKRVRFRPGDSVKSQGDQTFTVSAVEEQAGLLVYQTEGPRLPEAQLSDSISFNKPEDRLFNGQIDPPEQFDLRLETLQHQYYRRKSEVRGFVGGRIDLIPHQLYIAHEVASRHAPRVLLADEVGLGKTIEACLTLHRLLASGRVERVLVLVPEPLIHQWFIELQRRFNLWFHIFDEERCKSIEAQDENPFLDDQLILCSIAWLAHAEKRKQQALAAHWDMLVVDEAHHLGWSPESSSPEYQLVEGLGTKAQGLLLLTATPEQLGLTSHFARLRLLDPDRYYDYAEFLRESEHYQQIAKIADKLLNDKKLSAADEKALNAVFGSQTYPLEARLQAVRRGDSPARQLLIDDLLDQHGTGRVMFRNTRATISGFPKRIAHRVALQAAPDDTGLLDRLALEFAADSGERSAADIQYDYSLDPRISWLIEKLRHLHKDKVLLICRSKQKAEAILEALRQKITIKAAAFHEQVPLVQRDRNAAWFGEVDGAQILICSEIGSEGRNFQFAHHLVLFDLPLDPEIVEQRIGRLDRIGQTATIQIHIPFVKGSSQEVMVRWYHDGLNAFEKNLHGGHELLERFGPHVKDLASDFHETGGPAETALADLIGVTRAACLELTERLEKGRDRLLEMNSYRPPLAKRLVGEISARDQEHTLDHFMLRILDHYGIQAEELSTRTFQLGSGGVFTDSFPALRAGGMTVTCSRKEALAREDIAFLTWDHPMVTGAMDLMLGSEAGNSSFAIWSDQSSRRILLESIHLLECVAPARLHVDRFLPATPIRIVLDHDLEDCTDEYPPDLFTRNLKPGSVYALIDRPELRQTLLPEMLEASRRFAEERVSTIVKNSLNQMESLLGHEIDRLQVLKTVNANVRQEEIELARQEMEDLREHISSARLRLDALRLISNGQRP